MGFEPGYTDKPEIVKNFLLDRAERRAELPKQVHAIWCDLFSFAIGSHD